MSLNLKSLDKRVRKLEILISQLAKWTKFQPRSTIESDGIITAENARSPRRKETARKSTSGVSKSRNNSNSEDVFVEPMENVTVKMETIDIDSLELSYPNDTPDPDGNLDLNLNLNFENLEHLQNEEESNENPPMFQDELDQEEMDFNFDEDLLQFNDDDQEDSEYSPENDGNNEEDDDDADWNFRDEKPKPKCKKRTFERCASYYTLGQQWRRRWRNFEPLFIPSEEEERASQNPIVKMDKLTKEELEGMGVSKRKRDFEPLSEFDCDFCDRSFTKAWQLSKHRKRVHGAEKSAPSDSRNCPHCDKSISKKHFDDHIRVHTGERPFKCPHCAYASGARKALRDHVKSHGKAKPKNPDGEPAVIYNADSSTFECEYCDRTFPSFHSFANHRKFHKNEPGYVSKPRNRLCPICKKGFRSQHDVDIHIVVHTKEKPYLCNLCGKGVSSKSGLRSHMQNMHSTQKKKPQEKKHFCPYPDCGGAFNAKTKLEQHIHRHTGERPYKCDQCPYASVKPSTLKDHMKTHADASFQCGDCGRKLGTKKDFQRHREIYHTGDLLGRKFPCAHCSHDFPDEMKLAEHIYKNHAEQKNRIRCPHCKRKFDDVSELRSHLESLGEPRWIQRLEEMAGNQSQSDIQQGPSTSNNENQRQFEGGNIPQQYENIGGSEPVATSSIHHLF